jgi:uncharacterized PurR-regulated membrane protein YhhQ (DUF165 family)
MNALWTLIAIGGGLVLLAFATLVYLIPRFTPKGDIKTEFYSARAALWCVFAALVVIVIAACGITVKQVYPSDRPSKETKNYYVISR